MCLANVTIGGSGYIYKEEVVKSATRDTGGGGCFHSCFFVYIITIGSDCCTSFFADVTKTHLLLRIIVVVVRSGRTKVLPDKQTAELNSK